MDLYRLLESQKPLNSLEITLKMLTQKYAENHLDLPHTLPTLSDFFYELSSYTDTATAAKIHSANLEEHLFFQNGADVELYRHLRYLPAYWHSHSFIEMICVLEGSCTNHILSSHRCR